jgi:uncharacterized protein (TIGR02452 family)
MTTPAVITPKKVAHAPTSAMPQVEHKQAQAPTQNASTLTSAAPLEELSCIERIYAIISNWINNIIDWIDSWFSPTEEELSHKRRERRKEIWLETENIAKEHCLENIVYSASNSYKWRLDAALPAESRKGVDATKVVISEEDLLDMAFHAQKTGACSVMALNAGNAKLPGGGYKEGKSGREEEIMRRTTLAFVLDDSLGYSQIKYPLAENEAIYAKQVTILRAQKQHNYAFLDTASVGFVTVAPLEKPRREIDAHGQMHLQKEDLEITRSKIRLQFHIAKKEKHDLLVLGAFGGDFATKEIAKLYKDVLEKEFAGCFKMVVFAIRDEGERQMYEQVFKQKHTTLKEALKN